MLDKASSTAVDENLKVKEKIECRSNKKLLNHSQHAKHELKS